MSSIVWSWIVEHWRSVCFTDPRPRSNGGSKERFPRRSEKWGTLCVSYSRSCFISLCEDTNSFWDENSRVSIRDVHLHFVKPLRDLYHKDGIPGQFRVHLQQNIKLRRYIWSLSLVPYLEKWWRIPCTRQKREKSAKMMFFVFRIRISLFCAHHFSRISQLSAMRATTLRALGISEMGLGTLATAT